MSKLKSVSGGEEVRILSPPFPKWGYKKREDEETVSILRMPTDHLAIVPFYPKEGKERDWISLKKSWLDPIITSVKFLRRPAAHLSPLTPFYVTAYSVLLDYFFTAREVVPSLRYRVEVLKKRVRSLEDELREERRIASEAIELASSLRSVASALSSLREGGEQLLSAAGDIQVLMLRVDELRSTINRGFDALQREISLLKSEIAEARRLLESGDLRGAREALEKVQQQAERVSEAAMAEGQSLPSYARNNPWLELISRKMTVK